MGLPRSDKMVRRMSADAISDAPQWSQARAVKYARRIVEAESRAPNDADAAMSRLEQRYGIGFWTLHHLWKGNAKTCDVGLYARLRAVYLDLCESQVTKLQHEIAIEKATGDDTLEDLESEAVALAAKIQAKKAALK